QPETRVPGNDARDGLPTGERLRSAVPEWRNAGIWFCGPAGFGEALKRDLAGHGFPVETQFHQELFSMRQAGRGDHCSRPRTITTAIVSVSVSVTSAISASGHRLWNRWPRASPGARCRARSPGSGSVGWPAPATAAPLAF